MDFFGAYSAIYNLANKEKTGPGKPKDHLDDHQHSHTHTLQRELQLNINNKQKVIVWKYKKIVTAKMSDSLPTIKDLCGFFARHNRPPPPPTIIHVRFSFQLKRNAHGSCPVVKEKWENEHFQKSSFICLFFPQVCSQCTYCLIGLLQ